MVHSGEFQKEIVIVTGASRGIGEAIADRFVEEGAYVIGTATSQDSADRITTSFEDLSPLGGHGAVLDFLNSGTDYDEFISAELEKAAERLSSIREISGKLPVEALVNSAGITRDGLYARMDDKDIDDVIAADLIGPMKLTRSAISRLRKGEYPSITTVSSVVGLSGNPGQANYAAAKGGLIPWSKSLAKELGPWGIRANVVAPGYVPTDMTADLPEEVKATFVDHAPLRRSVSTDKVAETVLFLASARASDITGVVLPIDAGLGA